MKRFKAKILTRTRRTRGVTLAKVIADFRIYYWVGMGILASAK